MNVCRACGEDFGSVEAFDAHRVGKHAYTFHEGLHMEPMREDGRRCLDVHELEGKGWRKNEKGRWQDPARSERASTTLGVSRRAPESTPSGTR
jgi:hypothetical protein